VLCTKVARYLDRTYSDQRLLYPMRRVGTQGRRPFRAHLLGRGAREIAARFGAIAARRRPAGHPAVQLRRHDGPAAVRVDGPPVLPSARAHRFSTARSALRRQGRLDVRSSARPIGMDFEQYENSKLILIWGSNPVASNLHFWTRAQESEAPRREDSSRSIPIAAPPPRSATTHSR
jgi:hypothetical protein